MKNKFEAESVKSETGSKNEENARHSVQKEIADIKEEVKNVKMGNSSTVMNGASIAERLGSGTFARY